MIQRIAYRAARAGIVTGILLAIARVIGETAPLLFTALNNQFFSMNMNAPMPSLPVVIFQFALSPYEEWQKLAGPGELLPLLVGRQRELENDDRQARHRRIHVHAEELVVERGEEQRCGLTAHSRDGEQDAGNNAGARRAIGDALDHQRARQAD